MKKKSLLLTAAATLVIAVAILLPTHAMAQNVPSYVPNNGLVGYWPFNGNANDESGTGNNGTVNGATLTTDRFANSNAAYSFNGISNSIDVQHSASLSIFGSQSPSTISVWFYGYTNQVEELINKGHHSINVPSYGNKFLAITNDTLSYQYTLYNFSTLNSVRCPNGYFNSQQWYHLVFVREATLKVYVNGINLSTAANNAGWSTNYNLVLDNTNMSFGCRNNKDDNNVPFRNLFYNGKIDDIGIWNRALTPCEIAALFASNTNGIASITTSGNTSFCQGGTITLTGNGGGTYNWSNGSSSQSITVNNGGNYTVTVTNGNCTATASQNVTVNSNPSVSFSLPTIVSTTAPTFGMNGNPSGGTYTGAGVSGSSFNPSAAGLGLKQVNYTYSNVNGCSGSASSTTLVYDTTGNVCTSYDTLVIYETVYDTVTTTVNDTVTTYLSVTDTLKIDVNLTGINPPNNSNLLTVYPNPAKDHLLINCGNYASMSGYSIKITNTLGQIVFNQPITQQQFYIDLSTWGGAGTYIMYITDQNQTVKSQKQIVLQ